MEETLKLRQGISGDVNDIVVHPRSKEDIQKIVTFCNQERIPVYVYGGGSSVTKGLISEKGGVTLVMDGVIPVGVIPVMAVDIPLTVIRRGPSCLKWLMLLQ